jgi:VIT1/CCC1 family predicted Fe2+/Mn2+ transporter
VTDPESSPGETEQRDAPPSMAQAPPPAISATGPGKIFEKVTHALTDSELTNPAVVKMIIDRMRIAEAQREEYREYVDDFHAKNTDCEILKEKLKTSIANEIMFGAGLTIGGVVFGLAPYFWDTEKHQLAGVICIGIGALLALGAIIARVGFGWRK